VKIDRLTPSHFNINDFAGQLGLKDGQKIIGRIVESGPGEVLLQLAGKIVAAKLEGEPVPQGALVLLGVSLPQEDRIELKVIENLAQPAEGREDLRLPVSAGDPRFRTLISAALKEFGLNDSAQNIEKLVNVIKAFESQYQQLPDPKVFTFLLGKNWPVTPGMVLFSWLYQDRNLRKILWNLLDRSPWIRSNPLLQPRVLDLGAEAPVFSGTGVNPESELFGPDEPIMEQASPDVRELQTPGSKTTYSPEEIGKLKTVLEKSLLLAKAGNGQDRPTGAETLVPFLVRTPERTLREYVVRWKEKSNQTEGGAKEEAVRLVIPTENMGEVALRMLVSSKKVRIGLKVMSGPVKDHITRNLSDLRTTVGPEAQIAVSIVATKSDNESRMDLWM
jgi:hypothetical protein